MDNEYEETVKKKKHQGKEWKERNRAFHVKFYKDLIVSVVASPVLPLPFLFFSLPGALDLLLGHLLPVELELLALKDVSVGASRLSGAGGDLCV